MPVAAADEREGPVGTAPSEHLQPFLFEGAGVHEEFDDFGSHPLREVGDVAQRVESRNALRHCDDPVVALTAGTPASVLLDLEHADGPAGNHYSRRRADI